MNKQLTETLQRRSELLAKIAVQREQVATAGRNWHVPLALADSGIAAVQFARSHPVFVAGIVSLFLTHRRGMTGLARGAWRAWKGYRFLTTLSGKISNIN